jgi:ankyrin repeat protein
LLYKILKKNPEALLIETSGHSYAAASIILRYPKSVFDFVLKVHPDFIYQRQAYGPFPIHIAANAGKYDMVFDMIKLDPNLVNAFNSSAETNTPLMNAIRNNTRIARDLLKLPNIDFSLTSYYKESIMSLAKKITDPKEREAILEMIKNHPNYKGQQ